jgi:rusticyanin
VAGSNETRIVMTRKRISILTGLAVIAAVGLGVGMAAATSSPSGPGGLPAAAGTPAGPGYAWYHSMMGRYYGGSMMGESPGGWMMGRGGYQWMMGGTSAPGWMRGDRLPGPMMGTTTDPGKVMGRLWANAPGLRVSASEAARLGSQVPAGASINQTKRTVSFAATSVHLVAVASPADGPDETFRIAGLVNPTVIVPAGSRVHIEVINADPDTAHGLVITAGNPQWSWMPMMTASPAFAGSALWFLGDPTSAGMHEGTIGFTAASPGSYHYLCPVPGHAQKGMVGAFIISR